MAQRYLLVERVARIHQLQIPCIKPAGHLEDPHLHRIAFWREGVAVAKDHRDVARSFAKGRQRITVDRRVRAADFSQRAHAHRRRGGNRVSAQLGRILDEGLHRGGEPVDGGVPLGFVSIAA